MASKLLLVVVIIFQNVIIFALDSNRVLTELDTQHYQGNFTGSRIDRRLFAFRKYWDSDFDPVCGNDPEPGICTSWTLCKAKGGTVVPASPSACSNRGICCRLIARCPLNTENPCLIKCSGKIIKNENSPVPYSRTYRFIRPKHVCQLKLNFHVLSLSPPNLSGECNTDALVVQGMSMCGFNNGQHAYYNFEDSNQIDARIIIQNPDSRYSIRTTFIKCDSSIEALPGARQYFTETVGTIMSFGFGTQSNRQHYTICIKRAEGMNQIRYSQCNPVPLVPGQTNPVNPFFVTGVWDGMEPLQMGTACTTDWVQPNGLFRYCGSMFVPVTTSAMPFCIHVNFDHIEGASVSLPTQCPVETSVPDPELGGQWNCIPGPDPQPCTCIYAPGSNGRVPDLGNTGFCLMYMQLP